MKKLWSIISVLLVSTMCMAVAGCGSQPTTSAPSSEEEKPALTESPPASSIEEPQYGGSVSILCPAFPTVGGGFKDQWSVGTTLYFYPAIEPLVGMTEDGLAPTKLATGWEIAPDGSSITFTLRQGVKFHDGTDFNAEAVKWNLEMIRDQKSELKCIEAIDCVDEHTVRLNLSEYSNTLLYHLAWYDGCMISPASYEDADYAATHMIGTGPFVMTSFEADSKVVFKKFNDYWDEGKPYLDELVLIASADVNTNRSALLTGQAQIWDRVVATEAAGLVDKGYKINVCPGLITCAFVDSANEDSPFYKKEVRYAFEYAIDKQALCDTFGGGMYEVPVAPRSSRHIGASAVTEGRSYDPEKAKALLAEAGYPNGFKTTMYFQTTSDDDLLEAIQGYLLAVGINLEMQVVDTGKMAALRSGGWNNGLLFQSLSTANPNYCQTLQTDGPGPTKSVSTLVTPEYTELLKKASAAITLEEQEQLFGQLVQLTFDECMMIPLYGSTRISAFGPSIIHNCDLEAYSVWFYNPAEIWMSNNK